MKISLAASWAPSICEGRASPQTTNVARHHASKANQSAVVGQGNATLILRSGRAGAKRPLERAAAAPRTSQLVLGRANCLSSWQVREITLKLPFLTRLICIATAWHCFYPGKSREKQSQASRTHSRPPVCDRQNSKHLKIKQIYPFCVYKMHRPCLILVPLTFIEVGCLLFLPGTPFTLDIVRESNMLHQNRWNRVFTALVGSPSNSCPTHIVLCDFNRFYHISPWHDLRAEAVRCCCQA